MHAANIQKFVSSFKFINALSWFALLITIEKQMFNVKISLFSNTKELEQKIDMLHDKIIEAAMVFKKAVNVYLQEKRSTDYRKLSKEIKIIEFKNELELREYELKLKHIIKEYLYTPKNWNYNKSTECFSEEILEILLTKINSLYHYDIV